MPDRWRGGGWVGVAAVALFAGGVGLYADTLPHPFANLDDAVYVTENPRVHDGLTAVNVGWALTTGWQANYHPLTWLSLQLDATLFGGDQPGYYRFTNLILHGANAAVLFLVLRRLTGATGRSLAVAALWLAHPQHVESVVWVTERKDVLSQLFGLLAVGAYAWYVDRPSAGRMAAVGGLMLLSLASKPMFVTLPCALLLLDFWPLRRNTTFDWDTWRPLVWEKAPLFALAVVWSVVAWAAQDRGGATAGNEIFGLPSRVANAALAYVAYARQTVWPAGLSAYYPHDAPSLLAPLSLAALATLAAVTYAAARVARSRPYLLVGWLWFLGTLVPAVGLVQVGDQGRADRYTYLPQIGLLVAGVWAVADLVGRWAGVGLAVAATVGLSAATVNQARLWGSNADLWRHSLAVTSDQNYKARQCLAGALLQSGKIDEAVGHARAGLALRGGDAFGRMSLGMALAALGQSDESLVELQKGSQLATHLALPHWLLGKSLLRFGRAADALPELTKGGQTSKEASAAECIIAGRELLARGLPKLAREKFLQAFGHVPGLAEPQYLLAQCEEAAGGFDLAAARYRDAIRNLPNHPPPYARLALVLDRQGDRAGAVAAAEKAVALRPESPVYRAGLGQVYAAAGRDADADAQYAEATRLAPDWADSVADLALTAMAGPDPAAGLFEAGCQATQATQGTKFGKAAPLAALAAVRAAEGRGREAAELAEKAAGLADRPDTALAYKTHAAAYRAGKTLRDYVTGGR